MLAGRMRLPYDTDKPRWVIWLVRVRAVLFKKCIHAKQVPYKEAYGCVFKHLGVEVNLCDTDHWNSELLGKLGLFSVVFWIMPASIELNREKRLVILCNENVKMCRQSVAIQLI